MMEQQEGDIGPAPINRLLEAYAKSLAVYYAAEKAFMDTPTLESLHHHGVTLDRLYTLRDELRRSNRLGDAVAATEADETVGR